MMLKTILEKYGTVLISLGVIWMTACGSMQTDGSNDRLSNAESPTATVTPLDSPRGDKNANKKVQARNEQLDKLFAESPMLDIPECIALESLDIARQREANVPDEEIRRNIFANRNVIRTMESDPNKYAEVCKKMIEWRQKIPYQPRPKK